jgi:hypothetical protein
LDGGKSFYICASCLVWFGAIICGKDSTIAIALGRDFKGKISVAVYAIAIPLAFVNSLLAFMLHVLIAIVWLIPVGVASPQENRRIEKAIDP